MGEPATGSKFTILPARDLRQIKVNTRARA